MLVSCKGRTDKDAEKVIPAHIYKEPDYTLAELAYKLLEFEKYEIALELVHLWPTV